MKSIIFASLPGPGLIAGRKGFFRALTGLLAAFFLLAALALPALAQSADSPDQAQSTGGSTPDPNAREADPARNAGEPSLERMAGQMFMFGFRGTGLPAASGADQADTADLERFLQFLAQGKAGGVILFSREPGRRDRPRNITGPEQLKALTARLAAAAPQPLFIAVDQEGGKVQRLAPAQGFWGWPSAKTLGGMYISQVRKSAHGLGQELAEHGFNLNFAPCVDLDINPQSPAIGALGRSFGADHLAVISRARAFSAGLKDAGVISCLKHFPGHGSAGEDTHEGTADVSETWEEEELAPYVNLLRDQAPQMVMVGHIYHRNLDPDHPASLSQSVIGSLLRGLLDWNGVVISDDLQMKAVTEHYSLEQTITLAVNAGMDILLFGNNLDYDADLPEKAYSTLLSLVEQGKISPERIRESYTRIMKLKEFLPK